MKNLILSLFFLLQCNALLYAQNTGESLESVLSSRSAYYQKYVEISAVADSAGAMPLQLRKAMEDVIRTDDIIIEQYLFKEYDRANDLQLGLAAAQLEQHKNASTAARFRTIAIIAVPAALLLLLVSLWFLILLRRKSSEAVENKEAAINAELIHPAAEARIHPLPEDEETPAVSAELSLKPELLQEEMKRERQAYEAALAGLEADKLILASKLDEAKAETEKIRTVLSEIGKMASGSGNAGGHHSD